MSLREDCNGLSKCFIDVAELILEGQSHANLILNCNLDEAYSSISIIFDICEEGKNQLKNCLQQLENIQAILCNSNADFSTQKKIGVEKISQKEDTKRSFVSKDSQSSKSFLEQLEYNELTTKTNEFLRINSSTLTLNEDYLKSEELDLDLVDILSNTKKIQADKPKSNASSLDVDFLECYKTLKQIHESAIRSCKKYKHLLNKIIEFAIKKSAPIGIFAIIFTNAYIMPKIASIVEAVETKPIITLLESIHDVVQHIDNANPNQTQKTVELISSSLGIEIDPEQIDTFKVSLVNAQKYSQEMKELSGINDQVNSEYMEKEKKRQEKWKKGKKTFQLINDQYLDMNYIRDANEK